MVVRLVQVLEFLSYFLHFVAFAAAGQHAVHHRHNHHGYDGGEYQSADYGDAHRPPYFGAFAGAQRQRQHTENGGKGGHQHGAQTRTARHHDGVVEPHIAVAHQVGEVHQHDAVFHHNPDQQYRAQGGHQAQGGVGEQQGEDHPGKRKGDGEHNDKRHGERLKLRGHHDKYQDQAEHHQQAEVHKRLLLVFVRSAYLYQHILGHLHLADFGLDLVGQVAQGHVVGFHRNGDDALLALMLYGGRPPVLGDGADLLQLDPFAHGAHDGELLKVGDGTAVVFRKPDADIVLLSFFLVLRGGHSVDAVAHHSGNGGAAEPVQGQLLLVEHHLQLGLVVFAAHGNFGGR